MIEKQNIIKYNKILSRGGVKYTEKEAEAIINCLITISQILYKTNLLTQ